MKKFTVLATFFLVGQVQAQFQPYSQYNLTPTLTNPAAVGMGDHTQVTFNYRQARVSAYEVPAISFIYPFYQRQNGRRYGGMGFTVITQTAAAAMNQTTGVVGGFAYDIQLSRRHHIGTGLQLGWINKRIDPGAVTTDSQFGGDGYDPTAATGENFVKTSTSAITVSPGFTWYVTDETESPKAWLGVAFYNANRPNYAFRREDNRDPVRYLLHGSLLAARLNKFSVLPTFRYIREAGTNVANVGSRFEYVISMVKDSKLGAGIWYNTNQSLGFNLQYAQEKYLVAFGYDASVDPRSVARVNSATEIALSWRINRKKRAGRLATAESAGQEAAPSAAEDKKPKPEVLAKETPREVPAEKVADQVPAKDGPEKKAVGETPAKPLTEKERTLFDRKLAFPLAGTELSPEDEQFIDSLATILKQHPELTLKTSGHTCSLGSKEANEKISLERAEKVTALMRRKGVPERQLSAVGYDYQRPIASNETESGRIQNRRVEFELLNR